LFKQALYAKVFLIYFAFKFAKTISFLFVMVFLTANYESNKILTSKIFDNGSREINSSFRPIKLEYLPEKVVIGTILYRACCNLVFSLCYAKITLGKFYLLKLINIKTIAIRIMYLLFGITRVTIKIIIKNTRFCLYLHLFEVSCFLYTERLLWIYEDFA